MTLLLACGLGLVIGVFGTLTWVFLKRLQDDEEGW